MRIIIIGGVIAGVETALQARNNSETAEIVIYDRDRDIAHTAYATHYVAGGIVKDVDQLTLNSPEWFKKRHNIDILPNHEITSIDYEEKRVHGVDLTTNEIFEDSFDALVFANGSSVTVPPVFRDQDFKNVFTIKSVQNARNILNFIKDEKPKTAVVVGAGYIGLGVSEQLTKAGIKVQTVDFLEYPMAQLDEEMSIHIAEILKENNVDFHGNEGVVELNSNEGRLISVKTSADNYFSADMFVVATGVRPNTELAESIGVQTGVSRAVKVNDKMETNLPEVYAVGDVAEGFHAVTKNPLYLPLAATAVKMGRVAGDVITGGTMRFNGVLGTSAVRLFDYTIASTGMTEAAANKAGYNPVVSVESRPAVLEIMGGKEMLIKAVADADSDKLLGVEIIGPEGVERRIDVFATAMQLGATISDLLNLDLAFTPPISTPTDPVVHTALSLERAIENSPFITPEQLKDKMDTADELKIVDVREKSAYDKGHIKGAINIAIDDLRAECVALDTEDNIIVYCKDGEISGIAQRILVNNDYMNVFNLAGGIENYNTLFEEKE